MNMKKKQLDLQNLMIDILYQFCERQDLNYDSVVDSMMARLDPFNNSEIEYFSDEQEDFIARYINIDDRVNDHIYFNDQYRVVGDRDYKY